jgi:peptide/nickel transport system permease protein
MTSVISRVVYSSVVETKREEFVETGIIRGVGRSRFFWFYILKPSLAPTVVLLSYMMGTMLGATVILETIFSLPGIGRELVTAVLVRDYPVVQGIVLVFGAITVFLSFIGDLVAYYLDRRVQI